ncbi:FAD-binding domain-containing protein [Mytilinidion resinicola]|uniref:FAD-binding domain-containing protein n=1 Tax=Mytilinidion resinicola TaxID=574789 RepID=A0A6A6Y427_9PEZI|nr:FAD-binding domain-containing protein [Mytilinidion resinicola]KAF2803591.1 FAD-binding domain-containing protein [Mytilinidion resinicola]
MRLGFSTAALLSAAAGSLASDLANVTCGALADAGLASRITYPGSTIYEERVDSYWSLTAQLTPWCILQPHNAKEVSTAVKALVKANKKEECLFAVRSGGHTTWPGAANIENGITIDLGLMNSTTYIASNNTAQVLPGSRWLGVYETLDALGIAAAGGRAATVGVAGLAIGGGNSFYAARKGLVCDNIAQYEVVLASGEIIYANNKTNTDLFRALKGGTGNFGIVTRLDLETFQGQDLWGGVVTYPNSTTDAQIEAFVNFGNNIVNDQYGSAIVIWQYTTQNAATILINAYEYTKPQAWPPAFDEFKAIPNRTSDSMRFTNMTDLTIELEQAAGYRDTFITLTFVNDKRVVKKAVDLHNIVVEKVKAHKATGNWTVQDMVQPIPTIFTKHSVEKGGNMLGLDRFDENLVLFQTYLAWEGAEQDDFFQSTGDWYIAQLSAYAKSIGKDNPYIYLDYAYATQKPLENYGAVNIAKIKAAAKKYDPTGVFQKLVPGGFKISKVQ